MDSNDPAAFHGLPNTTSNSSSAAEIHLAQQLSPITPSPSLDSALTQASMSPQVDTAMSPSDFGGSAGDTDPQILEALLEALRSKDRLWVLKLGENMESLITERQ